MNSKTNHIARATVVNLCVAVALVSVVGCGGSKGEKGPRLVKISSRQESQRDPNRSADFNQLSLYETFENQGAKGKVLITVEGPVVFPEGNSRIVSFQAGQRREVCFKIEWMGVPTQVVQVVSVKWVPVEKAKPADLKGVREE